MNIDPYEVAPGGQVHPIYPGEYDGAVRVVSTNAQDIFASERQIFGASFSESIGIPGDQLTTEYWFPWYDFTQVSTWIVIGNTSSVDPADVEIYIGGAFKEGKTIEPDGQWAPAYPGEFNGPVQVKSTNGVPILVSQRMLYNGGLQETLGFPATQLTTEYWYSWYDFTAMSTWIVIGNTSSVDSADVEIYIGGALKESKTIAANGQWAPAYPGEFDGPVQVKSTNGVKILTSQRAVYNGRLNETLGLPANQLTSDYWYTLYDGTAMSTWIVVGNTSSIDMADVEIYIAGALVGSQAIDPNGQWAPAYVGVLDGPVEVKSTNGVKIFTSQRLLYNNYFKESPGYPAPQLTTDYWFPWYDYTEISSWILIARP
jgi:hypothetical protein